MGTLLENLRQVIGEPNFYITSGNYNSTWDYGAMIEYFVACVVLCVVITSVFRFLGKLVAR